LISASSCPHYDGEENRRPAYRRMVQDGELPAGWAADDGAGLVFEGKRLREVVSSRPEATAYRVRKGRDGTVQEVALQARFLGGRRPAIAQRGSMVP
jgi:dipeptidase E